MTEVGAEIRRLRQAQGWTGAQLAVYAGMAPSAISQIETGRRSPNAGSLDKIAKALKVEVVDLFPKARSSSPEPSFDDVLDDERHAAWEAAVAEGRRLRDTGRSRMWKALSEWSASKQRGEPYATRREYLDEMGDLLQEVYGAYTAVGDAYIEAALTQGGSEASVPSYLREESRAANDFYVELFGLVRSAGLGIRTGDDAAAAKRAAKAQPEGKGRPHEVEEPAA